MARRGRPTKTESVLRSMTKHSVETKTPIASEMYIPNHSGDHSAGKVFKTPTDDLHIANKKYVDDEIATIPTPTLQSVTDEGNTTDNDIEIYSSLPRLKLKDTDAADDEYGRTDFQQSGQTFSLRGIKNNGTGAKTAWTFIHNADTISSAYSLSATALSCGGNITTTGGDIKIDEDNKKLLLGEGQDSSIYYNGTNMIIDPQEVGSGLLFVDGKINAGYNLSGVTSTINAVGKSTTTSDRASISAYGFNSTDSTYRSAPAMGFLKSHSNTIGTLSTTQDGERIGTFAFSGVDGANTWRGGAGILVDQDGAATTTDVPMKMYFYSGTNDPTFVCDSSNNAQIPNDNKKLLFGAGQDASIYYDGTNLKIKPDEVGTGEVIIPTGRLGVGINPSIRQIEAYEVGTAVGFNFEYDSDKWASCVFRTNSDDKTRWAMGAGGPTYVTGNEFYIYQSINAAGTNIGKYRFRIKDDGSIQIPDDDQKLIFGAGQDGSIYYDGSDLIIDPQEVGSGGLKILNMKSGSTQANAGAAANELWKTSGHASLPDNVVMIGV